MLKDCWDRRDPSGGIADPLLGTGHQGLDIFLKDGWDRRDHSRGIANPLPGTGQ